MTKRETADGAREALAWLEHHAKASVLEGMARYGIVAKWALGVTMADMKVLGKRLGRSHTLAAALWKTGLYEARMVASLVDEPERVTPTQMDRWCRDFDNWAICDTVCFNLFDRTPYAFSKVEAWSLREKEFEKRASFALLASLALHGRAMADEPFLTSLGLVEHAAEDERNFVKKAVSWALRAIGRKNATLNAASLTLAKKLGASREAAPRWVGKDALRELTSPAVQKRLSGPRKTGAKKGADLRARKP